MTNYFTGSNQNVIDTMEGINRSSTKLARVMIFIGTCQIVLAIAQVCLATIQIYLAYSSKK